jgi:DNA-directed RNA polymerase II subunit RPB1
MATQAPYAEVERLRFSITGDNSNEADAVVEVTNYDLFANEQPVTGGCFDPRMGTTDHHYSCVTCGHGRREDPGHYGLLRLRMSVTSPLFVSEVRRWLRVLCLNCGTPVVDLDRYQGMSRSKRLSEAATTATDGVKCASCQTIHPKIVAAEDDYFTFYAETTVNQVVRNTKIYPDELRTIFEKVTEATVLALGRPLTSHPVNLVLKNIIVPPNTIRPGVRMGFGAAGASSHHDLTNLVQYLVKRNLSLPETMPDQISRELDRLIQNTQQVYYDMVRGAASTNVSQGSSGRRGIVMGNRSMRSILLNLPRKDGRLRKNLLGKRVWNISRSTICGNPLLRTDEVGFPLAFARMIQIQETVQEFNRDRLMSYFLNGRRQYPGCSRVIKRSTGVIHRVEGLRREFLLEVGDVIERDIITGDFAYFNRQPSLERSAIGVHHLVVLEDPDVHTFQMNVTACAWYGADFDGDQMNLWIPSSIASRVEAKYMSAVANWFISTKSSSPVNGQVQDSCVGSFELTRSSVSMDKIHFMSLFATARVGHPDMSRSGGDARFSGRDVVSRLFETTPVNYQRPSRWFNETYAPFIDYAEDEVLTVMKRGRLEQGVLDSSSVGSGAGGIYHLISREHGSQKALDMIFALQQVAVGFLDCRGFTVSTGDMTIGPAALTQVQTIISGLLRESELITERLIRGELVPPIGMTTHEYYERLQSEALKVPDDLLRPVLTSIRPDWNGLFRMIATGSKGSTPNLLHIMALIGQVSINTQRISEQFAFRRTCVYSPRFSTCAASYGFVKNSYITGMNVMELTFSTMNGRFDLINKALSTASTGYQNRKAIMALQSAIVDNFRRVTKDTRIAQMLYGEDGLDARQVERVPFRTVFLSDADLARKFRLVLVQSSTNKNSLVGTLEQQAFLDAAFKLIVADRDNYRAIFLRFEDSDFSSPMSDARQVPVNVARLVRDVQIAAEAAALAGESRSVLISSASVVVDMQRKVDDFCLRMPYLLINEIQERRGTPVPAHLQAATGLMQMLVRTELSAPVLASLTPAQLDYVLAAVRLQYSNALIDPGTAAGILAAQAVSEPLTQYMLDSHHRSVAGGTDKGGIVRPAELFGAKPVEAEQSSEMFLRVRSEIENDRTAVLQVANQIELMMFSRFISGWAILLEPFAQPVYPPFAGDATWIDEFLRNHPLLRPPTDLTNWCARFELDKSTMILKSMQLELIIERLRAKHPHVFFVHSSENAPSIYVRAYFRSAQFRRAAPRRGADGTVRPADISSRAGRGTSSPSEFKVRDAVRSGLLDTVIRGVRGVLTAEVVEAKRHQYVSSSQGTGEIALRSVYAIKTVGTNLYGVLSHRQIDPLRAVSSSIGETAKIYGIAAARAAIVREVRRFMGAKSPNVRHLLLYADEMTRTGRITSLEKGGVNIRERDNVFLRMAMAAPTQVLQESALQNAEGRVYGISPYLMLGRAPRLGTTWNSFQVDEEFVQANTKSVDDVLSDL